MTKHLKKKKHFPNRIFQSNLKRRNHEVIDITKKWKKKISFKFAAKGNFSHLQDMLIYANQPTVPLYRTQKDRRWRVVTSNDKRLQ